MNGRGILAVCDENHRVHTMIQNQLENLHRDSWEFEFSVKPSESLRIFFIAPSLTGQPGQNKYTKSR